MESIDEDERRCRALIASASEALGRREWAAFRSHMAALREHLLPYVASGEERSQRVREIVDALAAASPAHDPEGCRTELAALAELYGRDEGRSRAPWIAPMPVLDLRGLEPPQPIVRILDALERAPDETLRVVLPHEPHPLYALLRERGFAWSGKLLAGVGFELTIGKAGSV